MAVDGSKLKVAVLMGGIGSEREISLQSGATIAGALREAGVDVVEFDIAPDRLSILDDESIDVFFPALHGEFGEDGHLQEIFESKGLCYVGSDSKVSKIAFDKVACKNAVRKANVPIPLHVMVTEADTVASIGHRISALGYTFVVKPPRQGSSVGVQIIKGLLEASEAAMATFKEYGECMVEQFIDGRELTVGIVDGQALPVVEIRSKTQFYDYNAKYLEDSTEYLFDTIEDEKLVSRTTELALISYNVTGCRHLARADFILTDDGTPYFLEINTLPGFTSHSLLPLAAAKAGMNASRLCMKIVETALNGC